MNRSLRPTRQHRPTTRVFALAVSTLVLSACGGGFQSASLPNQQLQRSSGSSSVPGASGPTGGRTPTSDQLAAWEKLQVDGAISGSKFNKTPVLGLDKTTKELMLRLPMLANAQLDGMSLSLPVDSIPGARMGLEPMPEGGSALVLRLPLLHVLRGVRLSDPARLPNGDALPSIPSGELPSTAIDITKDRKVRATVYMAPAVLALFINTPFDPYLAITLPVRSADRTRTWGYFSTIPAKKGLADGGFFISVALPSDVARAIDDML